jgi:hypothetical protein
MELIDFNNQEEQLIKNKQLLDFYKNSIMEVNHMINESIK